MCVCVQELRVLVYPLVQVLLGAARLVPAPRYFPLRLRLAAALHRLAASAGVLVPLAPLLLEMLTWADLAKAPQVCCFRNDDDSMSFHTPRFNLLISV